MEDSDACVRAGGGATAWMMVPAFGDWDMKNGAMPDYSMDFSKIRKMRKQNKKELSRPPRRGDFSSPTTSSSSSSHPSPPSPRRWPLMPGTLETRAIEGARDAADSAG
ncbi:hypothetical protein ZWY2020_056861 [Hordeum vulgare]|nr:hypothetical protein ZWY2020_056861 [Hordeum vulgare]